MDREPHLLALVRYIHLNPRRSGMPEAESYPWTSHRQYLGRDRYPLAPVKSAAVLARYSRTASIARAKYKEFMREEPPAEKLGLFADLRGGRILGDEDFEAEVSAKSGIPTRPSLKLRLDLDELWKAILRREGMAQEPTGWRRSRLLAEAAWLAVESGQIRQKFVADFFKVEPTTVNKAVQRLEARWEKGEGSGEKLDRWARGL